MNKSHKLYNSSFKQNLEMRNSVYEQFICFDSLLKLFKFIPILLC